MCIFDFFDIRNYIEITQSVMPKKVDFWKYFSVYYNIFYNKSVLLLLSSNMS